MAIPFELQDPPRQLVDHITSVDKSVRLQFAPRLGFLAINGDHGGIHIVTFHSDKEDRNAITPVANLRERPSQNHRLDDNAKGLGIIVGNSIESISYPSKQERSKRYHGVWITPELLPDDIMDVRLKNMPAALVSVTGIGRHAYAKALAQMHSALNRVQGVSSEEAKLRGIEKAIQSIERRYGQAIFAVIDPAPTWLANQKRHGIQHNIQPTWGVYRDHKRSLMRIGSATAQEAQSDSPLQIVAQPHSGRIAASQSVS